MNHIAVAICLKFVSDLASLPRLPDDGVVDWQPGLFVPYNRGFPLIGNPDSDNLAWLNL